MDQPSLGLWFSNSTPRPLIPPVSTRDNVGGFQTQLITLSLRLPYPSVLGCMEFLTNVPDTRLPLRLHLPESFIAAHEG